MTPTLFAHHRRGHLARPGSALAALLTAALPALAPAQPVQFPTWQGRYSVVLDDRFGLVPASDARHIQGSSALITPINSAGTAAIFITPQPTLGPGELRFRDARTGLPASFTPIPQITNLTVPSPSNGGSLPLQIDLNSIMNTLTPRLDASGSISLLQSSQGLEGWAILINAQGGQTIRRLGDFASQFSVPVIVPNFLPQRVFDFNGRRHDNGRWAALVRLSATIPEPVGILANLQEAPGSAGPVRPYLFRAGEELTDGPMTLTTTSAFATGADNVPSPGWFFADDGSLAVITLATAAQLVDQTPRSGTVAILVRINPQGERTLIARTRATWESVSAPGFSNPKLVASFTAGPAMNSRGDIAFTSSGGLLDPAFPNNQRGSGLVVALASENHALRQVMQPGSQLWPSPTGPSLPSGVPVAQYTGLVGGTDVQIAESGDVYVPVNSVGGPGSLSIICWRASDDRLIRAMGFDEGLANLPGWRTRDILFSPLLMSINRAGQMVTATRLVGDTPPFSSQAFIGWDPKIGAQFLLPNALQFTETSGATRFLQAAALFSSPSYWQATNMGLTTRISEQGDFLWRYSSSPGGQITLAARINSACGAADLGRAGGERIPDGNLDNNDFVAFIGAFFEQLPVADLASNGAAPGPDGVFDNNDFVVFIAAFFAGCQ